MSAIFQLSPFRPNAFHGTRKLVACLCAASAICLRNFTPKFIATIVVFVMQAPVLANSQEHQVFRTVVVSDPVNMMGALEPLKESTNLLFQDGAMFCDISRSRAWVIRFVNVNIAIINTGTLGQRHARATMFSDNYRQVFRPIVGEISINVPYMFSRRQLAPERAFQYCSMLRHITVGVSGRMVWAKKKYVAVFEDASLLFQKTSLSSAAVVSLDEKSRVPAVAISPRDITIRDSSSSTATTQTESMRRIVGRWGNWPSWHLSLLSQGAI